MAHIDLNTLIAEVDPEELVEIARSLRKDPVQPGIAAPNLVALAAPPQLQPLPSLQVLERFWDRLGTTAQRRTLHMLLAHPAPEGVPRERLMLASGGKNLGGTLGGLKKNALEFNWNDWLTSQGEVYFLDSRFARALSYLLLKVKKYDTYYEPDFEFEATQAVSPELSEEEEEEEEIEIDIPEGPRELRFALARRP